MADAWCGAAFTILIAIICESFAAVMENTPKEGVIVDTIAWYKALSQSDDHDSAEEEDCSESDAQESSLREMLVQQGQQLRALQKDIQILKVCLRNL